MGLQGPGSLYGLSNNYVRLYFGGMWAGNHYTATVELESCHYSGMNVSYIIKVVTLFPPPHNPTYTHNILNYMSANMGEIGAMFSTAVGDEYMWHASF